MKKFVAVLFACLILVTSAVSAFAVISPNASTYVAPTTVSSDLKKDTGNTSPKTGSNDVLPLAFAGLAVSACATAVVKLAKSK